MILIENRRQPRGVTDPSNMTPGPGVAGPPLEPEHKKQQALDAPRFSNVGRDGDNARNEPEPPRCCSRNHGRPLTLPEHLIAEGLDQLARPVHTELNVKSVNR